MNKLTLLPLLTAFFTQVVFAANQTADPCPMNGCYISTQHEAVMLVTVHDDSGQPVASYSIPGYASRGACEAAQSRVANEVMDAHRNNGVVGARCVDI